MNKNTTIENEFKGVVALTKDQFETLSTTGTLTINGVTLIYDPLTTLYTIPDNTDLVDSELSIESTNPIQNRIVANKFNDVDSNIQIIGDNLNNTVIPTLNIVSSSLEALKGVTANKINILSDTVADHTGSISSNATEISTLKTSVKDIDETVQQILNNMLPTVVDLSASDHIIEPSTPEEGDAQ